MSDDIERAFVSDVTHKQINSECTYEFSMINASFEHRMHVPKLLNTNIRSQFHSTLKSLKDFKTRGANIQLFLRLKDIIFQFVMD